MAEGAPHRDATLASDAEREWVCAHLQESCVQGRLTTEELSHRLDLALRARTRSELDDLLADLPPPPGYTPPPPSGKRWHLGVVGSTRRTGRWRVPAESWWTSVMGGCRLDLTRATFESAVTTINIVAAMGGVEVRVPKGFEIDMQGTALLGGRHLRLEGPPPPPGAPVIRLRVMSCLGGVKVTDRESLRARLRQY
ncbi:MAG TPA: DUF1707 domain-containing protein [Actinomycetota bacterium]|nr:DUF1707 domain-containing protein [Actinomycetota bacterium]